MIRRYCDMCKQEIIPASEPVKVEGFYDRNGIRLAVKVAFEVKSAPNQLNDICKSCVLDAVASLDDRIKIKAEKQKEPGTILTP